MALYFGRPLDSNQCTLLNDKVVFWLTFCHSVCPCPSVSESRSAYWLVVFIPLTGSSLLIYREKWPLKIFAKPNEPAKVARRMRMLSSVDHPGPDTVALRPYLQGFSLVESYPSQALWERSRSWNTPSNCSSCGGLLIPKIRSLHKTTYSSSYIRGEVWLRMLSSPETISLCMHLSIMGPEFGEGQETGQPTS